jgi:hypothetical protein
MRRDTDDFDTDDPDRECERDRSGSDRKTNGRDGPRRR